MRDGMVMAARPGVGGDSDALFEFLRRRTRDAADLEAERLLYVACTRAKSQLYLTATLEFEDDDADSAGGAPVVRNPHAGSLLAVLWPVAAAQFGVPGTAPHPGARAAAPRGGPLRRLPAGWVGEPTDGIAGPAPDFSTPREPTPVFDWAGETARRVGILVHAELQSLDPERSDEAAIRAREPHFRRWLALHGVPPERLPDAAWRVTSALLAIHQDPRARWILDPGHRDGSREYALSGRGRAGLLRVVFDRSFVDGHGVRWVIDYKTSEHAGGRLEEFLDREVERYRPQLQRYAELARKLGPEPVRVGLYFPLMRAWREWAP
jgi:ATP-dependent exoDNAse (exonuclease V) beta subunit